MSDYQLKVISRTENGVCCANPAKPEATFWLSVRSCRWSEEPKPGSDVRAEVPDWLARKHRQLVGDDEFEKAKRQPAYERKMQMADQRELSGVLSRNKKRETEKQPEYKGTATINGTGYWLSAWVKEGPDGKFFSLAFTPKDQPSAQAKASTAAPYRTKTLDDPMPF
jgi:hypothetical protein